MDTLAAPADARPDPDPGRDEDRAQRPRLSLTGLALLVYVAFAVVQHAEVVLGLIDETASWWLTAWNLTGGLGFVGLVASGLNRRCTSDPGLAMAQSVWALVGIIWSYAITGPARGGVMLILVLVLVYGIFTLSAAQSRLLAGLAFGMLALAMVYKGWTDPGRYDPRVEAFHLVFAAVVIGAIAALTERHGRLRARLVRQRHDLTEALERIRELATLDELTGLLNRRAVADGLHRELRRRGRDQTLCVALVDLDHFKHINDAFGHTAGDRVLRGFADVARALLRKPDLLSRWGGEEFLFALPDTDERGAMQVLERIREALRAHTFDEVAPGLHVSFSAGLSACRDEADLERAIERADRAMYAAKAAGRDRITQAPPEGRPADLPPAAPAA